MIYLSGETSKQKAIWSTETPFIWCVFVNGLHGIFITLL